MTLMRLLNLEVPLTVRRRMALPNADAELNLQILPMLFTTGLATRAQQSTADYLRMPHEDEEDTAAVPDFQRRRNRMSASSPGTLREVADDEDEVVDELPVDEEEVEPELLSSS